MYQISTTYMVLVTFHINAMENSPHSDANNCSTIPPLPTTTTILPSYKHEKCWTPTLHSYIFKKHTHTWKILNIHNAHVHLQTAYMNMTDIHLQTVYMNTTYIHLQTEYTNMTDIHLQTEYMNMTDIHLQTEYMNMTDIHLQTEYTNMKDSEDDGSKQSTNLICFKISCKSSFNLLFPFQNTLDMPHPWRMILSCTVFDTLVTG